MVRRTHHCRRCGAAVRPGDVYAVVDVLDEEGRLRELLCRTCGRGLRAFVEGGEPDRDDAGAGAGADTTTAADRDGAESEGGPSATDG